MLKKHFEAIEQNEEINSADGMNDSVFATGGEAELGSAVSSPFILRFTNTSGSNISDWTFLDALRYAGLMPATGIGDGTNGLPVGITGQCMLAGWTFKMFLEYIKTTPMRIGRITTKSDAANTDDLDVPYTIEWYNGQGSSKKETVFPEFNLANNIGNQIDSPVDAYLQGTTVVTHPSISAGYSLTFKFYPVRVGSSLAGLGAVAKEQTIVQTSGFTAVNNTPKTLI